MLNFPVMKKYISFLLCLLLLGALQAVAIGDYGSKPRPLYAPDLVKVKLSSQAVRLSQLPLAAYAETGKTNFSPLDNLILENGGTAIIRSHIPTKDPAWEKQTGFDRWFIIRLDGSRSVEEAIASFKTSPYIEEATPEYYAYLAVVPNDTYYPNHWGHNNTAQLPVYQGGSHSGPGVGTVGFDSDAQLAWDHQQYFGSENIVIAIIDTGADLLHADLRLVTGYDYGDNDSNPTDNSAEKGHGTSCSGVAAAIGNNGIGVVGIAAGCSVMPLKIATTNGQIPFSAIENALIHTGDNGVRIASMSFGAGISPGTSPATDAAITYANNHGVTMLAATGNGNSSSIQYPANHALVIGVGAASPTGQRKSTSSSDGEYWWGSNYGANTQNAANAVDIMAPTILPTTDISGAIGYSTTDYFMWFNGTSCATPYAAGVAALILSKDPTLSQVALRNILFSSATDMTIDGGEGWDRYTGYGLINANAALQMVTPGMPLCQFVSPGDGSVFDIATQISFEVQASDLDGSIVSVQFFIDDNPTPVFTDTEAPYVYVWDTIDAGLGAHTIKAIATDNDDNTREAQISIILVLPADEGFESGDFGNFMWNNGSLIPWTVQNENKFSGYYAARSGAINMNDSTALSIKLNILAPGSISFYRKVKSAENHGFLRFYIDDVEQAAWSGILDWTEFSYNVSSGLRTFKWVYSNDSTMLGDGDCGWLDQICFPQHQAYYSPPQFFQSAAGNGFVLLNWQPPEAGVPTQYKVFRDGALLTSVTELRYTDTGLVNGQEYSYHLVAVFAQGESEPTPTITAIPSETAVNEVVIGTGNATTTVQDGCPINQIYRSLHGQSVYKAIELNSLGIFGPINITSLGFYIDTAPNLSMPSFTVRMMHTSAINVTEWENSDSLATVIFRSSYMPVAGGFDMLSLDTPFLWNGIDNLVVDTAFGQISAASPTGTVQYSPYMFGYRFVRNNSANQTNVFTGGTFTNYRPNLKISVAVIPTEPLIEVNTSSFDFGNILFGNNAAKNFNISNPGASDLIGEINTPEAFTVSLSGKQNGLNRNTLPFSIPAGGVGRYSLSFNPSVPGNYTGNVVITHNAEGEDVLIAVNGSAQTALNVPFVEGFENGLNNWSLINGTQANAWMIGTSAANTGNHSLYISSNGNNHNYNVNQASLVYAMRDITLPDTEQSYKLRFNWIGKGEGTNPYYDYLRVFLIDPADNLVAGQQLTSGMLGATYNNSATWQQASLDIPPSAIGQTKRLVFMWKNDSSRGDQPPAAIDNIRIVGGGQTDYILVYGTELNLILPPVTPPEMAEINPLLTIGNLNSDQQYLTVVTGFNTMACPLSDPGLDIKLSGADFSQASFNFTHNLGFKPAVLYYKIGADGTWQTYYSQDFTNQTAHFTMPAGQQNISEISFCFPAHQAIELPWQSITAILNSQNKVLLGWIRFYETGVRGYSIWRNTVNDPPTADSINVFILAESSVEGIYSYTDSTTTANTQYYYWLQMINQDELSSFFGPVSILTGDDPVPPAPSYTSLIGNYPNPFNPSTKLQYGLAEPGTADFTVYNQRGQIVSNFSVSHSLAGYYEYLYTAVDKHGSVLSSGVYYLRMEAGGKSFVRKILLLK